MSKIFTLLLFLLANLLSVSLTAKKADYLNMHERVVRAIVKCGDCLTTTDVNGNDFKVNALQDTLTVLRKELTQFEAESLVKDFLLIRIDILLNAIEQVELEMQRPTWSDLDMFNHLKVNTQNRLLPWLNKYKSELQVKDLISHLPAIEKEYLAFMVNQGDGEPELRSDLVWQHIIGEVKVRLTDSETYLYEQITPNKTFLQLENFLSFGFYKNKILNHRMKDAFRIFYLIYTADGEVITLRDFDARILGKKQEYLSDLLAELKQTQEYKQDEQLATQADRLVNSDIVDREALKQFIQVAAPKESAFVALQKLCAEDVDGRQYNEAIELASSYKDLFLYKPLYKQVHRKFEGYLALLRHMKNSNEQNPSDPLTMVNTDGAEIQFGFSKGKNFMAVIPMSKKQNIRKFQRDSAMKWKEVQSETLVLDEAYFFTNNVAGGKEAILEHKAKSVLFYHSDLRAKFEVENVVNTDYHFAMPHGIAFFVSTSDYARTTYGPKTGEPEEYASPWSLNHEVSTQFRESSRSFHGRSKGNGNTDIYFAFSSNNGQSWGKPKLLGNIVNTPFSERCPVISEDGHTLYFSSEGHGGLGGFDVFSVNIKIEDGMVEVMGEVRPVAEACSTKDDLFYNIIFEKDPIRQERFFSSDRKGNFDLYYLKKTEKKESKKSDIPSTKKAEPKRFFPQWPNKKLLLDLECDTFINVAQITPPGMIQVRGRIYDSKERFVRWALISFYNIDGSGDTASITADMEGKYNVLLDADKKYKITILAKTIDGDSVSEYLSKFTALCENPNGKIHGYQDFQTASISKLMENSAPTGFDFFYNTNQYVSVVNNMDVFEHHYSAFFKIMAKNPNIRLGLDAFADERGDAEHNMRLSSNRGRMAKGYLLNLGYSLDRLDLKAFGETNWFNRDDWKELEVLLPSSIFYNYNSQEKLWQLNRRVHVRFTPAPSANR